MAMLRLKQAIDECGIQQKALVAATGFGKTQVSLTLNSGKLPADANKFKDGVYHLAAEENGLSEWLTANNLRTDDLFEAIADGGEDPVEPHGAVSLDAALFVLAGRAVLSAPGGENNPVISLSRTVLFLQQTLAQLVGEDAPYIARIESDAVAILTGGTA